MKTRKRASRFAGGMFDELVVDNFAGGGGASLGIEQAIGRACDLAINHDEAAIEMHRLNHPATPHLCENIWKVDPLEATGGRPVGLAWFSPDCKHFSRAKGGKPVEKRIRGLAWVVVKWAKAVRPRVIILENVREFETWGPLTKENRPCPQRKGLTFRRWISSIRNLGYAIEWRVLNAADYGAPTHRRRLFLIARCDGLPIVWPEPTHGPGREPYHTAAECIDWSIPCPSIFERKRPLAEKTMRRIAMGIKRYVLDNPNPFIVRVQHGGEEFRGQPIDKPLGTVTAKHGYGLVAPCLAQVQNASAATGHRSVDRPAHTITANPKGGGMALVAPHLTKFRGDSIGTAADAPMPTITSGAGAKRPAGAAHALGVVSAHLVSGYGEREGQEPRARSVEQPAPSAVGSSKHALVTAFMSQFFGGVVGKPAAEPLPTVTAVDHNGLAAVNLTQFRGSNRGKGPIDEPAPALTAGGTHVGLSAACLARFSHGEKQWNGVDEPLCTVTSQGNKFGLVRAFLIKYFSSGGQWSGCDKPMPTVTAIDRLGLVSIQGVAYAITDIGLRMLKPRELARAQGFPDDYILTGSNANQVSKIGNSVCRVLARALTRDNFVRVREAVSA